jgi:hypothetical protein
LTKDESYKNREFIKNWISFSKNLKIKRGNKCEFENCENSLNLVCHHIDGDSDHYDDLSDENKFKILCRKHHSIIHYGKERYTKNIKGISISEATKKAMQELSPDKKERLKFNKDSHWINNGVENKLLRTGIIPDGWQRGRLVTWEYDIDNMQKYWTEHERPKFSHEKVLKAWETKRKRTKEQIEQSHKKFLETKKRNLLKKRQKEIENPHESYVDLITNISYELKKDCPKTKIYTDVPKIKKLWNSNHFIINIKDKERLEPLFKKFLEL